MAHNRTGLADLVFGGLIIGATALFVVLPGLCTPAYMGTAQGASAQVRHQLTALPAAALEVVGEPDDGDGAAAEAARATFAVRAPRIVGRDPALAAWHHDDGASMARFLERAGRLACPSTAPPHTFG